jgi:hypothetical protein
VALALRERHVLQAAAHAYFGMRVARLDHFGSYACRNMYGRTDAALSRHCRRGRYRGIRVSQRRSNSRHQRLGEPDPEGLFVRALRDGACRVFDGVLGPEYNAAHRDHFHFDRGGWRICR